MILLTCQYCGKQIERVQKRLKVTCFLCDKQMAILWHAKDSLKKRKGKKKKKRGRPRNKKRISPRRTDA